MNSTNCGEYGAPIVLPILDGLRVLVVEDDPDTGALLNFILTEMGAMVCEVASAQAALIVIVSEPFDLLISDIGLPGIDGYTLLRQVRALAAEATAQIPAIAITGFADEQSRLKTLSAGFQRTLIKPTDIDQFMAIVIELLVGPDQKDR
ncbi:MAG: response regulator [Stenomitos rutilans HA7619-LM2]|nr:response regulator [Stenomitos rutilans HA7619-LM2]